MPSGWHGAYGHARWYRKPPWREWWLCLVQPHCAYLFANRRGTRIKVLVHDGLGIWLGARRLYQGKFFWPGARHGAQVQLGMEQL